MARPKLIIASSESSADQLYASGFRAPDPFVFLERDGKRYLLLSDLEVDRGRSEARGAKVEAYSAVEREVQAGKSKKPSYARVVAAWLKAKKARSVVVPADFPFGLARLLRKEDIRLKPSKGPLYPERETKSPTEVRQIEAALRIAEAGMARGFEVLAATVIRKDGRLVWSRRTLTSELLRIEIESAVLRAGGEARGDTIVAGGEQACDPHGRGSGPLRAGELIILDIFPRDARSGFFGDITRTVVRGRASDAQRHLWETCLEGQKLAIDAMKPGNQGAIVHEQVKAAFASAGYPTEIRDGRWQGFFHGTGHGLGLEIHESPRFSATTFLPGQVLTVEPGIYIPGLGGVRHEDVALVTKKGARLLTKHPKPLEI
ncbi:MAG: Xaa-Pro peptidase family protein [Terrimicrobiaceae bacterium]|nr:Xaa-Pro peptidase family protein [Terrimicrobiaceae bacterium]